MKGIKRHIVTDIIGNDSVLLSGIDNSRLLEMPYISCTFASKTSMKTNSYILFTRWRILFGNHKMT